MGESKWADMKWTEVERTNHDRNIGISLVFCRIHRHKIILQSSTYALSRGLLETLRCVCVCDIVRHDLIMEFCSISTNQCVIGMEPWSLGGMEPCSSLEHGL